MTENDNPEQFSLRWNNFHANLSSGFSSLLQEEDLVDVTIAVDGRFVQAHKVVLSICSPYFKELFKINPCKHPIVILKDVSYQEMTGLLQFMYQGEVSISQDQLPDFLRAAELLHIKGLTGSESESPKSNKKLAKFEPPKRPLPPLKKKRLMEESTPLQAVSESTPPGGNRGGDRLANDSIPDFGPLTDEPTPGGSSLEFIGPKPEPLDYLESDGVIAFQEGEALRQEIKNISRFPSSFNSLSTMETSDGQGGFQMTSRGRLQLVRDGFVYHCNRQTEDKIFWKCAEYNRTRCRSRCISVGGTVTVTHASHNHQLVRRNAGPPQQQQHQHQQQRPLVPHNSMAPDP